MSSTGNIPPVNPREKYLAWCAEHADVFAVAPTSIGLTAAQATNYGNKVKAAETAVEALTAAKTAYADAVVAAAAALRTLRSGTSETVAIIRGFAENAADPTVVYEAASIAPPAPPTPQPAPNAPTNITVSIVPDTGAIKLDWKASQPVSGTGYIVKRRLNSTGTWQFVGYAGSDKTFTDTTFTAGPDNVQYGITAVRSNLTSNQSVVVVNFGLGGGGEFGVTNVKMAA